MQASPELHAMLTATLTATEVITDGTVGERDMRTSSLKKPMIPVHRHTPLFPDGPTPPVDSRAEL